MSNTTARWDLSNVYPGLESKEYQAAVEDFSGQIEQLEALFDRRVRGSEAHKPIKELAGLVGEVIERFNALFELKETIGPFIYAFVSTDSHNSLARKRLSEFEKINVHVGQLYHRFEAWIGSLGPALEEVIASNPTARDHDFALREAADQAKYLMSEAEENLAAELSQSSSTAWSNLQGTITSQLSAELEIDGKKTRMPLPAIINLQTHPDEAVRRLGHEKELELLDSMREPLTACMNGIKGAVNVLNRRRGRQDAVHSAIDNSRLDRPTLEAMLEAIRDSLPTFRVYFHAKARRLGKEKLAWWDLWAPTGDKTAEYSFEEARDFILERFGGFSEDLRRLAERAFDQRWIDAEMRDGKRGGAFCMDIAGVKESRVLCNFDGSLDQVSTIAHELGHAFHNDCMFRFGKTSLQQSTPMTLAETASILCETIIGQAMLSQTRTPGEELAVLENQLIGHSQVIVDIYSRYLFETEVFVQREKADLSAEELCEAMERAQIAAYGDGLDERYLNRYIWAWKPHYYSATRSFYNFPYSFGLLFGIGLYAVYQQRGAAFTSDYQRLLASTGEASAADLALRFGIDIRSRKFWDDSLAVIGAQIERYCSL